MNAAAVWLAFDFGRARIGVAVGQAVTASARALTVIRCQQGEPDWAAMDKLIQQWRPALLIVGRPLHADGNASAMTTAAQAFADSLHERYDIPIEMHDERLTSKAAEARFADARRAGKAKAKHVQQLDAVAACIILESWIREQEQQH